MRSLLRNAVLAGAVGVTTMAGTSPASADPSVLTFVGNVYVDCFGCAGTSGTAALTLAGTFGTTLVVGQPAAATFDAAYPPVIPGVAGCLVFGVANGTMTSGGISVDFTWTRVGAVAVITTSGDVDGAGTALFAVTDPLGVPCSQRVTATVVGAIGGF